MSTLLDVLIVVFAVLAFANLATTNTTLGLTYVACVLGLTAHRRLDREGR